MPKKKQEEEKSPHVSRLELLIANHRAKIADHRAKGRDKEADEYQKTLDAILSGELRP